MQDDKDKRKKADRPTQAQLSEGQRIEQRRHQAPAPPDLKDERDAARASRGEKRLSHQRWV
jgi:hypothetical protein